MPTRRINTQQLGQRAENMALAFLLKHDWHLRHRNWRCVGGEIDLVMQKTSIDDPSKNTDNTPLELIFVEVRYRKNQQFGGALASITPKKLAAMHLAANLYLHHLNEASSARLDLIILEGPLNERTAIQWVQNISM